MDFRSYRKHEEPEINFIPLIDLLLVILIFLMITTSYNRLNGLKIQLPEASSAEQSSLNQGDIIVSVQKDGWEINHQTFSTQNKLLEQLKKLSTQHNNPNTWVIIYANADTPYQRIIDTMSVAQSTGLTNITMATNTTTSNPNPTPNLK